MSSVKMAGRRGTGTGGLIGGLLVIGKSNQAGRSAGSHDQQDDAIGGGADDDARRQSRTDMNDEPKDVGIGLHQTLSDLFVLVTPNSFMSAARRNRPAFFMASVLAGP